MLMENRTTPTAKADRMRKKRKKAIFMFLTKDTDKKEAMQLSITTPRLTVHHSIQNR